MPKIRGIATERANRSVVVSIAAKFSENMRAGQSMELAAKNAATDEALEIYRPKVAAMLRSAGYELADDEPLSLDIVRAAIEQRTGLNLGDLSRESVTRAINEQLSIYVSSELGFEVRNVLDTASIKSQIDEHIKDCIRNNKSSKLVPQRLLTKLREVAAFGAMGYSVDERRLIFNRWYQKKYRRNNKLVWE